MNKNLKILLALVVIALMALIPARAVWTSTIEWLFHGSPIFSLHQEGERLEFGLRDDGVVVWRKITAATNSPQERAWTTPILTNLLLTNWEYFIPIDHGATNTNRKP